LGLGTAVKEPLVDSARRRTAANLLLIIISSCPLPSYLLGRGRRRMSPSSLVVVPAAHVVAATR
jgi:hypothetical protein